jgi:hypothetical protein
MNLKKLFRRRGAKDDASSPAEVRKSKPLARAEIVHNITQAVSMFRSSPHLEDDEIYRALVQSGMERRCAARLVELLPTAYSCVMLAAWGLPQPQVFYRDPGDGRASEERLFADEEVWEPALTFARDEANRRISQQDWLAVAARSSVFQSVNDALNRGVTLESLKESRTLIFSSWPEEGPEIS